MIRDTDKLEVEDPMTMFKDLTASKAKSKRVPEEKILRVQDQDRSSMIKGSVKSEVPDRNDMLTRFCAAKSIQANAKANAHAKSFTASSQNFGVNKSNPQLKATRSQLGNEDP